MNSSTVSRLAALLRQLVAILAAVEGSTSVLGSLPVSVRTALVAVGGILLSIEHAVAGVTSGAPVLVNTGATLPAPAPVPPPARTVKVGDETYALVK